MIAAAMVVAASLVAALPTSGPAPAGNGNKGARYAWYDGRWIDLTSNWEGATACIVTTDGNACFVDELAMNKAIADDTVVTPCGSALRLYDSTRFRGRVLAIATRRVVINLGLYGFNDRASSYKVGQCNVDFYSGMNAGGRRFKGKSVAGAQSSTLPSNWNDTISSVWVW